MDGLEGSYESGEPKEEIFWRPWVCTSGSGRSQQHSKGQDAVMVMDGITIYRSTNNFTIDGVTYNLTHEFEAVGDRNP